MSRRAVVTDAGRGIGREIVARPLARGDGTVVDLIGCLDRPEVLVNSAGRAQAGGARLWLASPAAEAVNRRALVIDGGGIQA